MCASFVTDVAQTPELGEDNSAKFSMMRTADGDVVWNLAKLWQKEHGSKMDAELFDGSEDANRVAAMLMMWIKTGMGAELNDGKPMVPEALIDELGDNAPAAVQTAAQLLKGEGLIDDKQLSEVSGMFDRMVERVVASKNDTALLEQHMKPLTKASMTPAKLKSAVRALRQLPEYLKIGTLSQDLKNDIGRYYNNVDEVIAHFAGGGADYSNKSLGMKGQGVKDGLDDGSGARSEVVGKGAEDSGSDQAGITENDGDFNSGINTRTPPKETIKVLGEYDLEDWEQRQALKAALEERADDVSVENIGVVEHLRAHNSGADLRREQFELVVKEFGSETARDPDRRSAALKEINRRRRVLIERKFEEGSDVIRPDQIERFRVKTERFDRATMTSTPIDDKSYGKVFIRLFDGTDFVTSAPLLVRTVRMGKGEDSQEKGGKVGAASVEEAFHKGLGQLLDALAKAGKIEDGNTAWVGYKHEAGGKVTWLKPSTLKVPRGSVTWNFPKGFAYLSPKSDDVVTRGDVAKENTSYGTKNPAKDSDLSMRELDEMSLDDLRELYVEKREKLEKLTAMLNGMFPEIVNMIRFKSNALAKARKSGDRKLAAKLSKELVKDKEWLSEQRARSAEYQSKKAGEETLKDHLEKIEEVASRWAGRDRSAQGERRLTADTRENKLRRVERFETRGNNKHIIGSRKEAEGRALTLRNRHGGETRVEKRKGQWGVVHTIHKVDADTKVVTEMDEMSENFADDGPINRDLETGYEVVTEPTDVDGYWKGENSAWKDPEQDGPTDKQGQQKRLWAVSTLLKGVPHVSRLLDKMTSSQLRDFAALLKTEFWKGMPQFDSQNMVWIAKHEDRNSRKVKERLSQEKRAAEKRKAELEKLKGITATVVARIEARLQSMGEANEQVVGARPEQVRGRGQGEGRHPGGVLAARVPESGAVLQDKRGGRAGADTQNQEADSNRNAGERNQNGQATVAQQLQAYLKLAEEQKQPVIFINALKHALELARKGEITPTVQGALARAERVLGAGGQGRSRTVNGGSNGRLGAAGGNGIVAGTATAGGGRAGENRQDVAGRTGKVRGAAKDRKLGQSAESVGQSSGAGSALRGSE